MRVCVIGAGHGGQALAGYLAINGADVTLYNRTEAVIKALNTKKCIEINGVISAYAKNVVFTSNLDEAVCNAEIIMVCIPSNFHTELAQRISPFLKKGQIIILNPGRTMGAYLFSRYINADEKGVFVAETDTFLLTARKISDGTSRIFSLKNQVYLASCKKEDTTYILNRVKNMLPMLKVAESMIQTSLSNIGVIFHPLPALLNIGRIECDEDFLHYKEGISPTIAGLLEKLDEERVRLSERLGCPVLTAREWIKKVYGSEGKTLYEAIQNTSAYNEVIAPREISTRYIFEDIATGIVPMYCMMKYFGEPCDIMELTIRLANELFDNDFVAEGRHNIQGFIECCLDK